MERLYAVAAAAFVGADIGGNACHGLFYGTPCLKRELFIGTQMLRNIVKSCLDSAQRFRSRFFLRVVYVFKPLGDTGQAVFKRLEYVVIAAFSPLQALCHFIQLVLESCERCFVIVGIGFFSDGLQRSLHSLCLRSLDMRPET